VVRIIAVAASAVLMLSLAGCVGAPDTAPTAPAPSGSASQSSAPPAPTASAAPALDPQGTATDNLVFFAGVIDSVWASGSPGAGRAYVDALVAAGFDKGAMQVTKDLSTVGNPAESMQVSVLWASECLVGQFGSATGAPHSTVQAVLPGDLCLLGNTRPIDW